ncbi:IclR family transcriptional regulator [Bordetella sp. BOR01]|uniref:IclR family transcriptional regulator n=1 Tax=Bordetella sp. BOR01 TaxID=2854779 RepID=UPI001C45A048|nr:IclR family transcriptional regulator [Bordetella sp. BOR01]MBV7482205.1 IclR family transcriptional regulator [Bordetella sp. BOR01]
MTSIEDETSRGTQVIRRIAALLRLLAANNRTGMRLVDLYRATGIERSTVHRLLQGLISERLVLQNRESKRYFLGIAMYEMGVAVAPPVKLRDVCQPYMNALAEQTGDTVFLTVRSGFDGVCVDRKEGSYPVKAFVLEPGRRRPLGVGAGNIAILAGLNPAEIARICAANRPRIRQKYPRYSETELASRIERAQTLGYTVTDVLETTGVRSVGMKICDRDRNPIAAISVSTLASRLESDRVQEVVTFLRASIESLEDKLRTMSVEEAASP